MPTTSLIAVLRWAHRNEWRPLYSATRRGGLYGWTNQVADPGNRRASTLRVLVDASGTVDVRQLMTYGWVQIALVRVGSDRGALDVLAALSIIPIELSPTVRSRQTERERLYARRVKALERLATCYRTGGRPSEPLLTELDLTRDALRVDADPDLDVPAGVVAAIRDILRGNPVWRGSRGLTENALIDRLRNYSVPVRDWIDHLSWDEYTEALASLTRAEILVHDPSYKRPQSHTVIQPRWRLADEPLEI